MGPTSWSLQPTSNIGICLSTASPHLECTLRGVYLHQLLMTFCLIVFLSLYHLIPPDKHLPCPSLITPSFTTKNKISTSATTIKTLKLEAPSTFYKNAQNTGILF